MITNREFTLLRDLVHKMSGIDNKRLKKEIFVTRLQKRLKAHKLESFSKYYELAVSNGPELSIFIDLVSTHTTNFFREPQHFEFIKKVLIPKLVAESSRRIRIWSAGCSSGEEPYSIAIAIRQALEASGCPDLWDIKIVASDISTGVLKTATAGIYDGRELSSIDPELLKRYFLKGTGKYRGYYSVKDEIKEMVAFKQINLFDEYPHKGLFDMVFCRNVTIYFDEDKQRQVVNSLLAYIKPDGHFFCGHSESRVGRHKQLKAVESCTYRKLRCYKTSCVPCKSCDPELEDTNPIDTKFKKVEGE